MRDDVVGVGPPDALPAGGEAAGAVAGVHEGLLVVAGVVPVDLGRAVEHRAPAVALAGVVGAAAAGQPAQPVEAGRGPQDAGLVGQPEHQLGLVRGRARLQRSHLLQLRGLLLPRQQPDRQPAERRRPLDQPPGERTLHRRPVLHDLLHDPDLRPAFDTSGPRTRP
ncbi:hypothetical protein JOD57_003449 [Geodermatophilus bullaregiensis]|nr:hypothetical protein [Geodermatophilus bullaregiensis]